MTPFLGNDATRCVHAGEDRHGRKASLTTDIAQTSVFVLPDVAELRRAAEGVSDAYLYTRYGNPTTTAAEEKIAALEGAEACVATASGMAAIFCAALAALHGGDEIVSLLDLYGGTLRLFEEVLARYGVKSRLVPYEELPQVESRFTEHTRMLFLESPTNPTLRCVDLESLARMAHRHRAVVVVDNTFATPILQKPLALGADMVVHSATKYLGGHSDVTAGAVAGSRSWMEQVRKMMKLSGGCPDPFCSYLLVRGLKTLELRVERACQNARAVAQHLRSHPKVERVFYPGLETHEGHSVAQAQMRDFGMMVSFDVKGGAPAAERMIDSLQLWYLATSLGGVESTVSYPVLSSHVGFGEERLRQLGVSPATIRLSLGIESSSDLIADLDQALERA
jgi:cystathionine beta-lyase/cystathionine gamma-synthase